MTASSNDPYLWLEEIESERSLEWVRRHNLKTQADLETSPDYREIEHETRKIFLAQDRLPLGSVQGGYVYNFWQDEKNVRGLWRRTPVSEYSKAAPEWEILLDIDELARAENENWVWQGADCLPPENKSCLILLSRGGGDAAVVREFDLDSRSFLKNGFEVPEAKTWVAWYDRDTVFVGTDFGPGTLTKSGYPMQVRLWKRGEPLSQAKILFTAAPDDMVANGWSSFGADGAFHIITQAKSFFESQHYLVRPELTLVELPLPLHASIRGIFQRYVLFDIRKDWTSDDVTFKAGSLLALGLNSLSGPEGHFEKPTLVFEPHARASIEGVALTRDCFFLELTDNILGKLVRVSRDSGQWTISATPFPSDGVLAVVGADQLSHEMLVHYQSFLSTPATYACRIKRGEIEVIGKKRIPARFDPAGLKVEQFEATSRDGTKVPYFVVSREDCLNDGSTPAVLYGYGGFEVSERPNYLNATGKVWVEQGGAWVVANIRGGGEFGPKWHQAALKENRQRAFDDFIAVAESLISRKITSPSKLAIMGGSNGGLLVGATFTQRPELFRAVVCQVPLLDMLRYHKLLAGHSWMAEYGDPDDPAMRDSILRYSPYQNLRAELKYPRVFFMTSTKDDRVHPGHARKMAARMEELGHSFDYFEAIEGGHFAAANIEQRVRFVSLMFTFLRRELGLGAWLRTKPHRSEPLPAASGT